MSDLHITVKQAVQKHELLVQTISIETIWKTWWSSAQKSSTMREACLRKAI
jgi:hypothetical protein